MNCWVVPFAIDGLVGVTAIDTRVAAVTVRVVVPLLPPEVAVIVALPWPTPDARPSVPDAFEIVATRSRSTTRSPPR